MDWTSVHHVIQKICTSFNTSDLKSAAAVSKTWYAASSKAFAANFRPSVQVPEDANDEAILRCALLNRFRLFNDLGFKFTSASISLDSVLGYVNCSRITRLKIEYEPTVDRVTQINKFLLRLSTDFQLLEELELRPKYGDPPEEELKVELGDDFDDDAIHHRLKVIKVPLGPNSGSGVDWRFLKSIENLVELHLLEFHMEGSGHLRRQISPFLDQFEERKIPMLALELRLAKYRFSQQDDSALRSLFQTTNPDTCTLFFHRDHIMEEITADGTWIVENALSESTPHAKLAVFMSVRLPVEPEESGWGLPARFAHHMRDFRGEILVRMDLHFEDGSQTFAEVERKRLRAPLVIRHGPRAKGGSWSLNSWLTQCASWMFPEVQQARFIEYNTMRKYVFGPDGDVVQRKQLYPFERRSFRDFENLGTREDDNFEVMMETWLYDFSFWRETEFSFPKDAVKVTSEPAWDNSRMRLPVSELTVISIENPQV